MIEFIVSFTFCISHSFSVFEDSTDNKPLSNNSRFDNGPLSGLILFRSAIISNAARKIYILN